MNRRQICSTWTIVATATLLGACGQKGPLYLPESPAAAGRATLPQTLFTPKARAPADRASAAAAPEPIPERKDQTPR